MKKKVKEKDIRILEIFCSIPALGAGILCILYLFDLLQNHWFLNFILGLGVLLHMSLAILHLLKNRKILLVITAVFLIFYIACLVYFNI